jgi:putative RecB family exonuclease
MSKLIESKHSWRPRESITSRPHWSYSQVSQFLRCPLQFYFERILRLPRKTAASGMVLGSAIHEGLAHYHRQLKAGDGVSLDQVKAIVVATFTASEGEKPVEYKEGETKQSVLDQGVALIEAYFKEPAPQNIVAIEEPMLVPLITSSGEILEKPLVAILDLLTRMDEGLLITEFKTSSRKFSESEAESALQASCYVHAVRERFDQPAMVQYLVLVKTKTPAVQRIETVRTSDDLGRIGDIVQAIERAIFARAFYPVETPMNCTGCPFRGPCRDWKGTHDQQRCEQTVHREPAAC